MATSPSTRRSSPESRRERFILAAYWAGALLLAGQAAVHIQQYVTFFHGVRWIGPLFLLDGAASVVALAGLTLRRWRALAALAGIAIAVCALFSLVVSYGRGLFGWQEVGFRTPIEWAGITEFGTVVVLASALAATSAWSRSRSAPLPRGGSLPPVNVAVGAGAKSPGTDRYRLSSYASAPDERGCASFRTSHS